MLTHVPGYNVTTDSIRSKTVKDSYVKWDAGVLVNAVTTTNSSLTLDNSHDSFYINNANAATISVTILNTINDYTANSNTSIRRINVIIDSRSAATDRTVTFTIPSTFTLIGGLPATRNLYHGNLQVFVVEIVNNTVNIYDGVGSYFEVDSNGDLMPLNSSADLVPRTDLSGQLGTGDKRWAAVYAGNITNTYDSVADMISDTSLKEGGTAFTKGYHNPNDGGAGVYNIRVCGSGEPESCDNGSTISLTNGNVAELIHENTVNVKQFGAYGNGTTTDDTAFQNIATYASAKNLIMLVPPATYKVTATITGTFGTFGDVTITGGGTVNIVNLKDVADDAQDSADAAATSESNALSYRNAAQTSAAAAAASASEADTTATALTTWLADKETLTAPAVDKHLTISGAAADAKIVGDNFNVIFDSTDLPKTFSGFTFGANNQIMLASYASMGIAQVKAGEKIKLVKHPNSKTFQYAFMSGNSRPYRDTVYFDYTNLNNQPESEIIEVPTNATYIGVLIYNSNMGDDSAVGKQSCEDALKVYLVNVKDDVARNDINEIKPQITDIYEITEEIGKKTYDIERTGWNYFNDKTEDYPGYYWGGSTVGGTIYKEGNNTYRAILVPIEQARYTINVYLRFLQYLDADKKILRYVNSQSSSTPIDNTELNASYIALSVYNSETNIILAKEGEKAFAEYTAHGTWVFDNLAEETILHHYLPSEICCAVGRTIELYNNLVCLEADRYHVHWSCSVGTTFANKFSITGTENNIGSYPLVMELYNDSMELVTSFTTTLKIVNASISTQMKGIPIGDSLTNQKAWMPEVQTLSNGKLKFIGTRGYNDAAYNHEGRSGATSGWYIGNNSYSFDNHYVGNPNVSASSNPFWDGEKFSLSHYNSMQSAYIGGTADFIVLLLGLNGLSFDNASNVANIKTIIDNIQSEYPNLPIFVCNTPYRSNQNGYYSIGTDGYQSAVDFQFSSDTKIMDLQNKIEEVFADYSNVFIVPMSLCMDREHDYGNVPTPVNPRLSTVTIDIPNESVHPQTPGYYQMADALWSSIAANLSA